MSLEIFGKILFGSFITFPIRDLWLLIYVCVCIKDNVLLHLFTQKAAKTAEHKKWATGLKRIKIIVIVVISYPNSYT